MLTYPGNCRMFLYGAPVDMRNGFEGLCKLIEEVFGEEVTAGAYFFFLNRAKDRVKVIYWDVDGLAIWYKRLEAGTFCRPDTPTAALDRRQLLMMLEGVTPKRLNKRFHLS